jgi:single-strand DNA-binding protein
MFCYHRAGALDGARLTQLYGPATANPCGARIGASMQAAKSRVFLVAPKHNTEVQKTMNNSLTIVGHVGQKPQTVSFGDTGNKVVKFSVAVKEFSPNSDEERTLWLDVDAWNGLGERALKTITKGREVVVNGRLAVSTYTKVEDGITKQITKPVMKLTSFHLCGKKPSSQDETQPEEQATAAYKPKRAAAKV